MSDPKPQSTSKALGEMIQVLAGGLPDVMKSVNAQILPSELAKFGSSAAVAPGYNNLTADLYDTSGRRLNEIGSQIQRENQLRAAATDAEVLAGPGRSVAEQLMNVGKILDPEYYSVRESTGNALNDRLTKGLGESERVEIERAVGRENARSGALDVPTGATAVGNALNFGRAGRSALDTALAEANKFLAAGGKSGFDTGSAMGKSSGPNLGESKFLGVTPPGGESSNAAANILGQAGQYTNTAAQLNANRATGLDKALAFTGNALGGY